MKKLIFISLYLISGNLFSQTLNLNDFNTLISKDNWTEVNQYLQTKSWEYYNSTKGGDNESDIIAWSFNKSDYNDEANGWFYIYTVEQKPEKLTYVVYNKDSYNLIQRKLSIFGYKLYDSNIDNDVLTSKYKNKNNYLIISTEKNQKEYESRSITGYRFTLIKKNGAFDNLNGIKRLYHDNGNLQYEYQLKDGKINGFYKSYNEDGNLVQEGQIFNGNKTGLIKEYKEGIIDFEYTLKEGDMNGPYKLYNEFGEVKQVGTMKNNVKSGLTKEYEDGILTRQYTYVDGIIEGLFSTYYDNGNIKSTCIFNDNERNGIYKKYDIDGNLLEVVNYNKGLKYGYSTSVYYFDDSNEKIELSGNYVYDKENGKWELTYTNEKGENRVIGITNYENGIKNGAFMESKSDSLIFGNYVQGELNGKYYVYKDLVKKFFGGIINTDTTKIKLVEKGYFKGGEKFGDWYNYSLINETLISKKQYKNNKLNGISSFYYDEKYTKHNDATPGELYLSENYLNGKLDGVLKQYSYMEEYKTLCDSSDGILVNEGDSCFRYEYHKEYFEANYKAGELDGYLISKNKKDEILQEGYYRSGKKNGKWIESYTFLDIIYETQKGKYNNGKRIGVWNTYFNDELLETVKYDNFGNKLAITKYKENIKTVDFYLNESELSSILVYDTSGVNILRNISIIKNKNNYYTIVDKIHKEDGSKVLTEYSVKFNDGFSYFNFLEEYKKMDDDKIKNGKYIEYDINDNELIVGQYSNGKESNYWKENIIEQISIERYKNSKLTKDEIFYYYETKDKYNGVYKYHHEDGSLEVIKIKDGKRNGVTIIYNSKGEKIKSTKYKNGFKK